MLQSSNNSNNILEFSDLSFDLMSYYVKLSGQTIILSPKEFQLLALLAQSPDKVFSSEEIFESIWDTESFGDYRTVMVHISNIRRKIERNPTDPVYIKTIKGAGYKFCGISLYILIQNQ